MNLLIDTVAVPSAFVFFNDDRTVQSIDRADISGKEFETFLESMETFCRKNGIAVQDLQHIVCVRGPAGFTGIRVVSLTLSTIRMVFGTKLSQIDAFELRALSWAAFPVLFRANREEYAYCESEIKPFEIRRKEDIPEGAYSGIALETDFEGRNISVESHVEYERAVQNLNLLDTREKIEPLYLKKPHITPSAWQPKA